MYRKINSRVSSKKIAKLHFKIGLILVLFFALLSVISFIIIPDIKKVEYESSTLLAKRKPFFKSKLLIIRRVEGTHKNKFLKKEPYDIIPITNELSIARDTLKVFLQQPLLINKPIQVAVPLNKVLTKEEIKSHRGEIKTYIEDNLVKEKNFLLGTDKLGRGLLEQILLGIRTTFKVSILGGIITLGVSLFISSLLTLSSNKIRSNTLKIFEVIKFSSPLVPITVLTFIVPPESILGFTFILGLSITPWVIVSLNKKIFKIQKSQLIESTKSLGFTNGYILYQYIIPLLFPQLIKTSVKVLMIIVIVEFILSYLGIGVTYPNISLGYLFEQGRGLIGTLNSTHILIMPVIVLYLILAMFNLLINGMDKVQPS